MAWIHLDSRRQRGAGLLLLASGGIQRAEAAVAVRLERAHGQGVASARVRA